MSEVHEQLAELLRDDALEAAMRSDTNEQYEVLSGRLDDVDRSVTRRRWIVGATALAAAALVVAFAYGLRPTTVSAPPAVPTPGPTAASLSVDDLSGVWSATMTEKQGRDTLAAAGLGDAAAIVLPEIGGFHAHGEVLPTYRFRLWFVGSTMYLYVMTPTGAVDNLQQFTFVLDGSRMTASQELAAGSAVVVFDAQLDGDLLRLSWVSDRGFRLSAQAPNEAFERVPFTAVEWRWTSESLG